MESKNPIVASAIVRKIAKNASEHTLVKVTLQTVTFERGKGRETKTMKFNDFVSLLNRLGLASENAIYRDIQRGGAEVNIDVLMTAVSA